MSSSDDDNVPLAQLTKTTKAETKKRPADDMDSDDDDMPLASIARKEKKKAVLKQSDAEIARNLQRDLNRRPQRTRKTMTESDGEDFDEDDDVPLAKMARKSKSPKVKTPSSKKKKSKDKKKKSSSSSKKKKSSSTSSKRHRIPEPQSSGPPLTLKHELAHAILQRWPYCLPESEKYEEINETDFIECGFKGVYVGIHGDSYGEINDTRKKTKLHPSLNAMLELPSEQLKEMLAKGIEKQIQDAEKHESGRVLKAQLKRIKHDENHCNRIDPRKAEKEYQSFVKRNK